MSWVEGVARMGGVAGEGALYWVDSVVWVEGVARVWGVERAGGVSRGLAGAGDSQPCLVSGRATLAHKKYHQLVSVMTKISIVYLKTIYVK